MKVLLYSSNSLVIKYIHPIVFGLVLGWVVRVIIEYIHAAASYHPGNINFDVMSSSSWDYKLSVIIIDMLMIQFLQILCTHW